jgi:DMSO/TMAO reductase YedYZ molybdopterin-dependent catalytic subunit
MSRQDIEKALARRRFVMQAAAGTTLTALGGATYLVTDGWPASAHAAMTRPDGRPRIPPGQRVLQRLKPMGGQPGNPKTSEFTLKVTGLVQKPLSLDFAALLGQKPVTLPLDVHCVTGWTVLGARFKGVRLKDLAAYAGVSKQARHVIFEAAHGYTSNVRIEDALDPNVLLAWELEGARLPRAHGGPVRAVVPDLYFWKSAKWLTGIRFVRRDEPGYWERRGYHNHADPWREERYG